MLNTIITKKEGLSADFEHLLVDVFFNGMCGGSMPVNDNNTPSDYLSFIDFRLNDIVTINQNKCAGNTDSRSFYLYKAAQMLLSYRMARRQGMASSASLKCFEIAQKYRFKAMVA